MKPNIIHNEAIDHNLWHKLLRDSEYASPFQTPDFLSFFNQFAGLGADVFAIKREEDYVVLCLVTYQKETGIKGYFSRRAIVYGGPLISEKASVQHLYELMQHIKEFYSRKTIYIEIRNYFDYAKYSNLLNKCGFKYIPWLNFHLATPSVDIVSAKVSKSRMRQIKSAKKNGVFWREAQTESEVEAFYNILKELYRDKIKKPLFDLEFFLKFFHSNIGKFLLVLYNSKVIGGIMCPILPGKSIYEFYVCGLDAEYKDQYPSIMATWAAIEFAEQNKISLFDFMGAGSPNEAYGVREFKARFGGEQVEYGRFLFVLNPFLFTLGKIGLKTLSIFK